MQSLVEQAKQCAARQAVDDYVYVSQNKPPTLPVKQLLIFVYNFQIESSDYCRL